jgi:hypothetical protein
MNRISAEPHALNHMKRTSRWRPSPSRRVLVASLATVGLAPIPMQVVHAAPVQVPCNVNNLVNAISSAASGDFLSLAEGCIYTLTAVNNSDPNLGDNGLPVITKTLTIKGNGATITRAQGAPKFRIFQVAHNGGDLTVSGLTVDNGDTSGTDPQAGVGGGIVNVGTLKVTNSTFSRNHASFGGGGIHNGIPQETGVNPVAGNLTLSNSVFFDNSGGIGAAIGNGATSTMNLTGCISSHNTASNEGGGIGNQGTAILDKCTIGGNTTSGVGGGIVNGGQLFLTDSPVTGNTATNGGGILNNGGQLFLTDSPIIGNSATGLVSAQSGFGGGILNVGGGTATLTHSVISGNSANNDGGGIVNVPGNNVTLTHSDVTGNSTTNDGGGIANGGHMTLTQSNVTGNNAGQNGGGIANKLGGANLTLTHSDVTDNKAGQGQQGGGIFNQPGNTVALNQSTVAGNTPDDF